jgi:hypothetical protein
MPETPLWDELTRSEQRLLIRLFGGGQRPTPLPTSGQISNLAEALLGQPYEPRQTSGTAADVYKKFDINAEAVVRAAYETLAEVGAL